jgi:hypothetical protein
MRRYASQWSDRRSTRSNKRCSAPPPARIALDDVARIQSTNVICTHARCKPVVSTTVVVTPAVVAVTAAVIPSGDRGGSCQEAQRCKSDKTCLHDGSPLLLRINLSRGVEFPSIAGAARTAIESSVDYVLVFGTTTNTHISHHGLMPLRRNNVCDTSRSYTVDRKNK